MFLTYKTTNFEDNKHVLFVFPHEGENTFLVSALASKHHKQCGLVSVCQCSSETWAELRERNKKVSLPAFSAPCAIVGGFFWRVSQKKIFLSSNSSLVQKKFAVKIPKSVWEKTLKNLSRPTAYGLRPEQFDKQEADF